MAFDILEVLQKRSMKWSLKTEQNVNSNLARNNKLIQNYFFLESLILAQDERWRHA